MSSAGQPRQGAQPPQLSSEYEEYLARFAAEVGEIEFGAFAKHNGQLIQKLRYEQFESLYRDFSEIRRAYHDSLKRGDTINDVVVKKIRELAGKLVLKSPA